MKKKFTIAIVIALGCLVVFAVYKKISTQTASSGTRRSRAVAVAVEVTPVQKTTIRDIGVFTGSLLARSQFVVAPKVAGRVEKLFVNIGDTVQQGQLITLLDDDEYVQQVEQAKAELDVAKANLQESLAMLKMAKREFERVKTLRKEKVASESELDASRADFETQAAKHRVALAQVAQKQAGLKAAEVRLSYTRITASWENEQETRVVGERFVDEGTMLKANDPIVSILDIHTVTAVVFAIERDYGKMQIGHEAAVTTDAVPGKTFEGAIVRVAPLLKETSRQARVEIEMPNPDRLLKPGMFVRAHIEFARHEDATVVPSGALVTRNGSQGVFIADTESLKANFVPVQVGIVNGNLSEVIAPPLTGSVVSLGQHLLEDGSPIILPTSKPTGLAGSKREHPERDSSKRPAGPATQ
jgi:RND family efflux transporter MFP subunit